MALVCHGRFLMGNYAAHCSEQRGGRSCFACTTRPHIQE
ncbi:Unknown protein sequence [Pseudomonas syringae pv. maculicola str. M6]|nr:Unknown protein sequence [Pseudomonas syringae pv. maculicola str. M6]